MSKTFQEDYDFGINEETKQEEIIKKQFGEIKRTNGYCKYDFYNDECIFELKSRNNKHDKYPTTLIAEDKIINKLKQKQIFIFNFTDGLYYIEYNKEKFDNYPLELFKRFDRLGHTDIKKKYYYIPITDLIKIII